MSIFHRAGPEDAGSVSGAPNLPSFGEHVAEAVRVVAGDVQSVVIPNVGHFVAEEAPDEMLAALTAFLAPYSDLSGGAANGSTPHAATV